MSSNKNSNSRGSRSAGAAKGRNSNNPSPNSARDSSRRPTTSPLDTTPATHDAGSPRNPEGDNIDTPVAPPLEATDIQNSEQQPTANESVEQLVNKLTTPTPPTLTTLTTVPTPPPATVDDSSHTVPSCTPIEPEMFPDDEDVCNISIRRRHKEDDDRSVSSYGDQSIRSQALPASPQIDEPCLPPSILQTPRTRLALCRLLLQAIRASSLSDENTLTP